LKASIIIPTYNRKDSLYETLASLTKQTRAVQSFEVIVVDDGSDDGTDEVAGETFPFALRYFSQENQGDAAARNFGVRQSQAEILVFLDDDMFLEPHYLEHLLPELHTSHRVIAVGTECLWTGDGDSLINPLANADCSRDVWSAFPQPFVEVFSRNMSLQRTAYLEIGEMQSLGFPGSSMWCDVEFAYRAYLKGYTFIRSTRAVCYHRDHASKNFDTAVKRNREAARRAVVLFHRYPELLAHLPMFSDKLPIIPGEDSARLVMRKVGRKLTSSRLSLWGMRTFADILERRFPTSKVVESLQRWMIGAALYTGYRQGLREFGDIRD
jgi:glycosyltransferase involved in cell wall biosynthesis